MAKEPTTTKKEPAFTPQTLEEGRAVYEITDKAPPYVAGRRLNGAKEVALTDDQARAELLAGHIWPKGMPRKARRANKADDAPAEAAGEPSSSDV